jgi:hypothetical protein
MNRHFSEEEICRWLAGERAAGWERHLESCPQCRNQASSMAEVLAGFQDSVRTRSAAHLSGYPMPTPQIIRTSAFTPMRLLAAAAALCLLTLGLWLPRFVSRNGVAFVPAQPAIQSADDDAALLRRVSADVSRTVPSSLEPLAERLEWPRQTAGEGR